MTHIIDEIVVPNGVRKRNRRALFLVLLALLAIGAGSALYIGVSGLAVSYSTLKTSSVRYGEVADVVGGYGNLAPKSAQALTATQGGTITYLAIQPGQIVKSGDTLAKLVNRDVSERLDDARKNYIIGKSEVSTSTYSSEKQLIDLHVTRDNLVGQVKTQAIKVNGEATLSARGVISKMAYMQDQAQLESLKRQLQAAEKELASLESVTKAQRRQNQEKLNFLSSQVEGRERDLESLVIRAPSDGTIYKIPDDLVVGRTLQPGGEIASFIEVNNLQAVFQISAADAPSIHKGMDVTINVGGRDIPGKVARIDPNVVQDQVKIVANIDDRDLADLLPGQPLNASIIRKNFSNVLYMDAWPGAMPNSAQYIYVVQQDRSSLEKVPIFLGDRIGSSILIRSGLKSGDRVVIGGLPTSTSREIVSLE